MNIKDLESSILKLNNLLLSLPEKDNEIATKLCQTVYNTFSSVIEVFDTLKEKHSKEELLNLLQLLKELKSNFKKVFPNESRNSYFLKEYEFFKGIKI